MARELPIPGRELKGVHLAMEYLTQQNKRTAGIPMTEEPITAKGKRVVIIGEVIRDPIVLVRHTVKVVLKRINLNCCRSLLRSGLIRPLGRSGRCSCGHRMLMRRVVTGNGASPRRSSPATMAM